jgi:hypothetical protein
LAFFQGFLSILDSRLELSHSPAIKIISHICSVLYFYFIPFVHVHTRLH